MILSACAGTPEKPQVLETKQTIVVDGRLLVPCPDNLSVLKPKASTLDVLRAHGEDVVTYTNCSDRHKSLVEVVKKALEE